MALTMPKGYADHHAVEQRLGLSLTADQVTLCQALIAAAESFIDLSVRRGDYDSGTAGWLNGPVAAEQYDLANSGNRIYLRACPVASVEKVLVRSRQVGDTGTTLVAGTDYELQNARNGLIVFSASYGTAAGYTDYSGSAGYNEAGRLVGSGWPLYSVALVDYTPRQVVPPDIREAATILAAHWLEYNINPGRYGLNSLTIQTYKYQMMTDGKGQRVLPQEAIDLIDARRRLLL